MHEERPRCRVHRQPVSVGQLTPVRAPVHPSHPLHGESATGAVSSLPQTRSRPHGPPVLQPGDLGPGSRGGHCEEEERRLTLTGS